MPLDEIDLQEIVETPLADTTLSLRTVNNLEGLGLLRVGELLQCCGKPTEECDDCEKFVNEQRTCGRTVKLMAIDNFGEKTLKEVFKMLEGLGLPRPADHPTLLPKRKKPKKKPKKRPKKKQTKQTRRRAKKAVEKKKMASSAQFRLNDLLPRK